MTQITAKTNVTRLCVEVDVTRAAEPLIDQIADAIAGDPNVTDMLTELATARAETEELARREGRGEIAEWRVDTAQAYIDSLREELVKAVVTGPVVALLNRGEARSLAADLQGAADKLTAPIAALSAGGAA